MKIIDHKQNRELACYFRGYFFNIARDEDYNNDWYIQVTDAAGVFAYDGSWRDSSRKSLRSAIIEACRGSMIEPPRIWPEILKIKRKRS